MATLYELSEPFMRLLSLMQSGDIDEEAYRDTIDSLDLTDIENKIESYIAVMDEVKASNDRIRNEEKRLAERRRSQEKNLKRMQDTLLDTMKLTNKERIKTDKYTVWTQNNPEKLVVKDDSRIPERFFVEQKPKLDKKTLLAELKQTGAEVEGVEVHQTESVRYR